MAPREGSSDGRSADATRKPGATADAAPAPITPEQALANMRALLEAKQQKAHQPPSYPVDDPVHHGKNLHPSAHAAEVAQERHLQEANSPAIHGHMAAEDRARQIKRDRDD